MKEVNLEGYQQTRGRLKKGSRRCYLGVLCDQSELGGQWDINHYNYEGKTYSIYAPIDVLDEYGMNWRIFTSGIYGPDCERIEGKISLFDFISQHNDAGFSLEFCDILRRTYGK